ncbi:hypothetical protein [Salana multivorans]
MAMILPPGTFNDGDREPAPSYGALLVARSEEVTQEAVLEALSAARFTGWVSPALDVLEIVEASEFAVGLAAGRTESSKEKEAVEPGEGVAWTVAVPETPLGHVAGDKTTLRELAASIAETLGTAAIAVLVRKEELLTVSGHVKAETWVSYASDAHILRPDDEFAWGPEGAHGAGALSRMSGHPEAEEAVYEILSEDEGEDFNESERVLGLGRLLGWPQWLVSVSGLPKRLLRGPAPEDFVRLRAGATGFGSRTKSRLTKVKRRSVLPADE